MLPPHGIPVHGRYKCFVFSSALTDVFLLVSQLARSMLIIKTHTRSYQGGNTHPEEGLFHFRLSCVVALDSGWPRMPFLRSSRPTSDSAFSLRRFWFVCLPALSLSLSFLWYLCSLCCNFWHSFLGYLIFYISANHRVEPIDPDEIFM
ncbi:unnamed protein product [Ectocarpus sp. 12 AP-2014]